MFELKKTTNGYDVCVVDGSRFSLPSGSILKGAAIEAARAYGGEDSIAVRILSDCDLDFEVVPGKDSVEQLVGVVIITSPEYALILRDPRHGAISDVAGALLEACSEIGTERIVARGESPVAPRKPKRVKSPQRADASPKQDLFVRQLTAVFIDQGRTATAFCEAARWGHLPLIKEILTGGVDVNVRNESGITALMLAAAGGHLDIVQTLIAAGVDVNATDPARGMSSLLWTLAAIHSERTYLSIIRELLNAGADCRIIANDGKTALQWARERGSERLVALLQEK